MFNNGKCTKGMLVEDFCELISDSAKEGERNRGPKWHRTLRHYPSDVGFNRAGIWLLMRFSDKSQ